MAQVLDEASVLRIVPVILVSEGGRLVGAGSRTRVEHSPLRAIVRYEPAGEIGPRAVEIEIVVDEVVVREEPDDHRVVVELSHELLVEDLILQWSEVRHAEVEDLDAEVSLEQVAEPAVLVHGEPFDEAVPEHDGPFRVRGQGALLVARTIGIRPIRDREAIVGVARRARRPAPRAPVVALRPPQVLVVDLLEVQRAVVRRRERQEIPGRQRFDGAQGPQQHDRPQRDPLPPDLHTNFFDEACNPCTRDSE